MKKILLLFIAITSMAVVNAQNCNAVFFSQDGQAFQVILNGVMQNVDYQTNVKVTDLAFEGNYKVTIQFMDRNIPSVMKTIYMMEKSTEYTYQVKMNKKGKYVLRASSMVPIAEAPKTDAQIVTAYSTTPPPAPAVTPATTVTQTATTAPTTTTTVSETVTTTTTTDMGAGTGTSENVSVNMNMGGVGMNVNVNVNDNGMSTNTNMNVNSNTSSTTTVTETTTVTTSSGYDAQAATIQPVGEAVPIEQPSTAPSGYSGPTGCAYPMGDADFAAAKKSISSKDFSDSRMTVAKQIAKSNCLTADQAKQIVELFDFEDGRLEFAKFAYGYTYDLNNYYKVNDAFEFESTIEELDEYIESTQK